MTGVVHRIDKANNLQIYEDALYMYFYTVCAIFFTFVTLQAYVVSKYIAKSI
jgi:hypothetical protein